MGGILKEEIGRSGIKVVEEDGFWEYIWHEEKEQKIGRFLLEWVPVSNGQGIVRNGLDMA